MNQSADVSANPSPPEPVAHRVPSAPSDPAPPRVVARSPHQAERCLPCRVASFYFVFGLLWIVLSDAMVGSGLFPDSVEHVLQTFKGIIFVLVSSGLIYFLLQVEASHIRRMNRELHRSDERLRLVLGNTREAVWDYDYVTDRVYWSETLRNLLGYEAVGDIPEETAFANHIHSEDRRKLQKVLRDFVNSNADKFEYLFRMTDAKARPIWVRAKGMAVPGPRGERSRIVGNIIDVSAQISYENALRRSARAMAALGMVSREISTTLDEAALLSHVCRLLVDEVGYKMAWVLAPQADRDCRVLTSFGDGSEYLPVQVATWQHLQDMHGPACQSILSGRVVRVRTEDEEPTLRTWRAWAAKAQVGAGIALPIPYATAGRHDELYMVLCIYTRVDDEFDEREARILETLGRDIGHALAAMREVGETPVAAQMVSERIEFRLNDVIAQTVEALAATLETRDPYTAGHEERVARLALAIASRMGMDDEFKRGLHIGGLLHDIGKIGIPAEILSKPSRLSDAEMDLVRQHPQIGYDIIKHVDFPWPVARIVREHHERMDGSGYPQHLHGNDICLEARIVAVADVIEAITSHRPYRPAHSVAEALTAITEPGKFDSRVVAAAVDLIHDGHMPLN